MVFGVGLHSRCRDQSSVVTGSVLLLLVALLFWLHPSYFGDAPWYARDLENTSEEGMALRVDAGHLLWRPLGLLTWWGLRTVSSDIDALMALQVLSSIATAVSCLGVYHLSLKLGLERSPALAAAALVSASHTGLAYGGSGTPYTAAMACLVLAFLPIIRSDREWSIRHATTSALGFVLAWSFWAVSALLLPAHFVAAALYSRGGSTRRFLRALAASSAAAGLILIAALIGHREWAAATSPSFIDWLRESDHGIPVTLSSLGAARAAFGFARAFVYFDAIGTLFRGLLLGDPGLARFEGVGVDVLDHTSFLAYFCAATVGLWRKSLERSVTAVSVSAVAASALAPVGAFALLWQGSDVERFSGSLPFVAIAIAHGLHALSGSKAGWRLEWVMVVAVLTANVATLIIPTLVRGGGLTMELARAANQSMPPQSLIVLTGGDLSASVWAPVSYFSHVGVHSVEFDAQHNGAAGWEERLGSAIESARSRGGEVAVLSDLLGEPTPGGIGLSTQEHPRPTVGEVNRYFSDWVRRERWRVGRFTFVRVERSGAE